MYLYDYVCACVCVFGVVSSLFDIDIIRLLALISTFKKTFYSTDI